MFVASEWYRQERIENIASIGQKLGTIASIDSISK
jgi:hypothetical protein